MRGLDPVRTALWLTFLTACRPTSARVAHRGGGAHFPENTRTAVVGALARGWDAVSFDVFLTIDRVPMLSAEPYLVESQCRTVGERPISPRVWLLEATAEQLEAGYRCGGVADSRFPDAQVVDTPPARLDVVIEALLELEDPDAAPDIHLVAGFQPNVSHDPAVFAAEILGRWALAEPPGALTIVADSGEVLRAFREDAVQRDVSIETTLAWPRLPPAGGEVAAGMGIALGAAQGVVDVGALAEEAGVSGVRLHPAVASPADARRAGQVVDYVEVGPVFGARDVAAYARWPVDAVLTSHPEL